MDIPIKKKHRVSFLGHLNDMVMLDLSLIFRPKRRKIRILYATVTVVLIAVALFYFYQYLNFEVGADAS